MLFYPLVVREVLRCSIWVPSFGLVATTPIPLQSGKTLDLLPYIPQLALEHGLHFGTSMMLCPKREQFFNFGEREPQFLGMPHKLEVANLLSVEQAIPACAATRTLD